MKELIANDAPYDNPLDFYAVHRFWGTPLRVIELEREQQEAFPAWEQWLAHYLHEPVYAIPISLLEVIERQTRDSAKPALFTAGELEAEWHFSSLCSIAWPDMIGIHTGMPIAYYLLAEPRHSVIPEAPLIELRNKGSFFRQPNAAEEQRFKQQRATCASDIFFDEHWQSDVATLKRLWEELPPFLQSAALSTLGNTLEECASYGLRSRDEEAITQFELEYEAILEKWSIIGLAGLELPLVPPVCLGLGGHLARHVLPPGYSINYVAPYQALPSDLDLRSIHADALNAKQREKGKNGRYPSYAPRINGKAASPSERCLRIWLVETAVAQRLPERRGTSSRLSEALAEWLGVSLQSVKKLRQRCRKLKSARSAMLLQAKSCDLDEG